MNEKNIIESADGTARIKMSSIGHAEMKEFVEKYAEKTTKTYSDIFISQLNDSVLNGVIKSKITEIISICRRAGLDDEDTREACADLIWPICNYKKFPELFLECMNDDEDGRFEYAYAITLHSAQGSQWDKVLYLHEDFARSQEDRKKTLYTAITRGVIGDTIVID